MNLKKSIFSYIVWAAFVPLCCLLVVFALNRAGIGEMFGIPSAGIIGGACVYLLLTAAVFIALRTICAEIGRHIQNRQKAESVLSVVLPVMILVGVVSYLVLYLVYHTPLTLEDDSFYRQALVSGERSVSYIVHGASRLYTCLLHVMLLIFGNTPFAGVVLQIILFFICLLLLYIGMQAFAGTLPAAVSMAAFGFLPVSLQHVFSLTPELFYLAFYLSGFALTGAMYRKFRLQGISSPVQYILPFLLGLYTGFLVYLDIYGISLYLFLAVLFSVDKDKMKQAAISGLFAVSGGICGFFLSAMAVFGIENIPVITSLQSIFSLYFPVKSEMVFSRFMLFLSDALPADAALLPDITLTGSMVLISLAFCVIPAFFLWKRSQCSAFILNLFLIYALSVYSVFCMNIQMIITFGWSILAGLGVLGMIRLPDESVEEAGEDGGKDGGDENDLPDKKTPAEETEASDKPEKMESKEQLKQKTTDQIGEKVQMEERKVPEKTMVQKREQEKPAPGEPLHNPLPVPKKKKRSAVDFGYQVKEEEMKFDIDVADNDDFDW